MTQAIAMPKRGNTMCQEVSITGVFCPDGSPHAYVHRYLKKSESITELMTALAEVAPRVGGAGTVTVKQQSGSHSLLWTLSFANKEHP